MTITTAQITIIATTRRPIERPTARPVKKWSTINNRNFNAVFYFRMGRGKWKSASPS